MPGPSDFASEFAALQRRVNDMERANRLKHASLDATGLPVYDSDGTVRQVFGLQEDGTYTVVDLNAPPPPAPAAPGAEGRAGLLVVTSYGLTETLAPWPLDFSRLDVHVGLAADFTPSSGTKVAEFASDGGSVSIALDPGTYYVRLVAVNTAGAESTPTVAKEATVQAAATGSGGVKTYRTDTEPIGLGPADDGAIWYDTSRGNLQSRWDGEQLLWIALPTGEGAIAAGAITEEKLAFAVGGLVPDPSWLSAARRAQRLEDDMIIWDFVAGEADYISTSASSRWALEPNRTGFRVDLSSDGEFSAAGLVMNETVQASAVAPMASHTSPAAPGRRYVFEHEVGYGPAGQTMIQEGTTFVPQGTSRYVITIEPLDASGVALASWAVPRSGYQSKIWGEPDTNGQDAGFGKPFGFTTPAGTVSVRIKSAMQVAPGFTFTNTTGTIAAAFMWKLHAFDSAATAGKWAAQYVRPYANYPIEDRFFLARDVPVAAGQTLTYAVEAGGNLPVALTYIEHLADGTTRTTQAAVTTAATSAVENVTGSFVVAPGVTSLDFYLDARGTSSGSIYVYKAAVTRQETPVEAGVSVADFDALDARVTTLEGQTLDARLDTLEGQNLNTRLTSAESKNTSQDSSITSHTNTLNGHASRLSVIERDIAPVSFAVTLAAGWSNFGAGHADCRGYYYAASNRVELQGLAKRTGANTPAQTTTLIGTIPAVYTASGGKLFCTVWGATSARTGPHRLDADVDGTLAIVEAGLSVTTGQYVSLTGLGWSRGV